MTNINYLTDTNHSRLATIFCKKPVPAGCHDLLLSVSYSFLNLFKMGQNFSLLSSSIVFLRHFPPPCVNM